MDGVFLSLLDIYGMAGTPQSRNNQLGGHDTMTDPAKLIAIMQVILSELEQTLSTAPEPTNEKTDARAGRLKGQIERLKIVLRKHQDAESRKRELTAQNKKLTRRT
jgi:hypothetical protein